MSIVVKFYMNQRLGEGHPDRKPRRAVVLGRMRSEPRERPAVYPAFALRATRGSSSLEDQTSSFSTLWRYAILELHTRNDDDVSLEAFARRKARGSPRLWCAGDRQTDGHAASDCVTLYHSWVRQRQEYVPERSWKRCKLMSINKCASKSPLPRSWKVQRRQQVQRSRLASVENYRLRWRWSSAERSSPTTAAAACSWWN